MCGIRHADAEAAGAFLDSAVMNFDRTLHALRTLLAVALLSLAWPLASAQDKPLRIVVGSTPGGLPDLMARSFGQFVTKRTGQPAVVENIPGASGKLAADAVLRGPADGHTLLVCFYGPAGLTPAYQADSAKSGAEGFDAVGIFGYATAVIVTAADSPWKTLPELGETARRETLSFGSAGGATVVRLYSELIGLSMGAKFTHVPYKGLAPALTDVAAGNVAFAITTMPPALPLLAAGRLRPLAVTTGTNQPSLVGVPTISQAGLKEADLNTWYGLWVKAGAPREVTLRLNGLLAAYMKDPETLRIMSAGGIIPAGAVTPEETESRLKADIAVWRSVVQRLALKLE